MQEKSEKKNRGYLNKAQVMVFKNILCKSILFVCICVDHVCVKCHGDQKIMSDLLRKRGTNGC